MYCCMEKTYKNLNTFFSEKLERLNCNEDTKAYIVNALAKYKSSSEDYSKDSITIKYAEAKLMQDFQMFDNIGTWILYCGIIYPEHLNNVSIDYYYNIGQSSFYSCYVLLKRKWQLYYDLAENLPKISITARAIIQKT